MEVLLCLYEENKNGKILELNVNLHLDSYLSPIALMLAYFVSTLSLIGRSQYELSFNAIRMNLGPKSNDVSTRSQSLNRKNDDIYGDAVPSMLEQFFYMVIDVTSIIYKNSYILLNIIMMVNIKRNNLSLFYIFITPNNILLAVTIGYKARSKYIF